MTCARCHGRGYIEDVQIRNGGEWRILLQCCDIAAYSRAVSERKKHVDAQSKPAEPTVCSVIKFRRKDRPNE
jgi:hypothetical protein